MWVHLRAFKASLVTAQIWHSLFLVSSWECSEIGMSLSIGWITFRLVALVCVFHLMSLTCFLPRDFVLISWLDTSFHFIVTYSMFWDMFMIIFLHCTPITGSVPHSLFDSWFDFWLDAHIFITERWKKHFHIHTWFIPNWCTFDSILRLELSTKFINLIHHILG